MYAMGGTAHRRSPARAASRSPTSPPSSTSRRDHPPRPRRAPRRRPAIRRVHGGAVRPRERGLAGPVLERAGRHPAAKRSIAQAALALVPPTFTGSILLDAGTTTGAFADALAEWQPARLAPLPSTRTPSRSRRCFRQREPDRPHHRRYRARPHQRSHRSQRHRPTRRHPPRHRLPRHQRRERRVRLSTPDELEATVKTAMVERSRLAVVLVDASKHGDERSADSRLDEVDMLVTDRPPGNALAARSTRPRWRWGGMIVTLTVNPSLDRTVELDRASCAARCSAPRRRRGAAARASTSPGALTAVGRQVGRRPARTRRRPARRALASAGVPIVTVPIVARLRSEHHHGRADGSPPSSTNSARCSSRPSSSASSPPWSRIGGCLVARARRLAPAVAARGLLRPRVVREVRAAGVAAPHRRRHVGRAARSARRRGRHRRPHQAQRRGARQARRGSPRPTPSRPTPSGSPGSPRRSCRAASARCSSRSAPRGRARQRDRRGSHPRRASFRAARSARATARSPASCSP